MPGNAKTEIEGASTGKLKGKTVAVKDNVCVAGVPMMNGSSTLEGYVPNLDATIITRLLDAGATIKGKAHCELFASQAAATRTASTPSIIALYLQRAFEMIGNTAPFDMTGHPAMSLRCGLDDGLPIGAMLVGRHYDEEWIYAAATAFEGQGDWKKSRDRRLRSDPCGPGVTCELLARASRAISR